MCLVSSGDCDGDEDGECDGGADDGEGDVDGFVGHCLGVLVDGDCFCFGECLLEVVEGLCGDGGFGFDDVVDELLCVVCELFCCCFGFLYFLHEVEYGFFLGGESVVLLLDCFFLLLYFF